MKIFIDSDFKIHTSNPEGTFREVETADERGNDFFPTSAVNSSRDTAMSLLVKAGHGQTIKCSMVK